MTGFLRAAAFVLLVPALARAQAPRARRVALPRLWASAEVPEGWRPRVEQNGFVVPPMQKEETPAVSISFEEGGEADSARRLRERVEASPRSLGLRGATEFRSGVVERRGAWSLGETSERGRDGRTRRALHAVLVVPGGWYLLEAEGTEESYARLRPDLLRLLDGFRREAPALTLAPYSDRDDGFSVSAPTAPWTAQAISGGRGVDFLGPAAPGGGARALISIQRLPRGGRYADADAYAREEARAAKGRAAGAVAASRDASGDWRRFETDAEFSERSAESAPASRRLRTAHAVLQRGKDLFVLTLQAPPGAYAEFRPVFDRVAASFRPVGP